MNKKNNNNDILYNSLFNSKNMYGELLKDTNKNIFPFIFGIRHKYSIIDLKNVCFFLKRISKLIKLISAKKNKILIIANSEKVNFICNDNFFNKKKNIIYLNDTWINGFITNKLFLKNSFFKKQKISLILIIDTSIDENFLKKELSTFQVPIISFLGTNQNLKNVNYPIISNMKNIKSIYTLMYFLKNSF